MPLTFNPDDIQEHNSKNELLPEGEYRFDVSYAEEKVSQNSGNEMIQMNIIVSGLLDKKPVKKIIKSFLVGTEKSLFKIKEFCEATGMEDKYKSGTLLADDCFGKTGRCYVIIKDDKNNSEIKRNDIKYFIVRDIKKENKKVDNFFNDDITF